jgi:hypothetical protein
MFICSYPVVTHPAIHIPLTKKVFFLAYSFVPLVACAFAESEKDWLVETKSD